MADAATTSRDRRGRFSKNSVNTAMQDQIDRDINSKDHNYCVGTLHICEPDSCNRIECTMCSRHVDIDAGKRLKNELWKKGRRIVEFELLLSGLRYCNMCRLGPVPLTYNSVIGELKKGLGGYLYVQCQNTDCGHVNCVPYGSTHHQKSAGMPCFAVNTKLGTAMIDSIGGPVRVNNFLSTLNVPTINNARLKEMERRAGDAVERVAEKSSRAAAEDAFKKEMQDIAMIETAEAEHSMEGLVDDLGVAVMPDSSPYLKDIIQSCETVQKDDWTDEDNCDKDENSSRMKQTRARKWKSPTYYRRGIAAGRQRKVRKSLASTFPCRSRTGMSCAVDTAWQKRGFDSLTSHTFFMSKAKYGKKVLKSIVKHRTCGTCKWWTRNRPNETVRRHRCVHNHRGSARLMESGSGQEGVVELKKSGTPVEYIEGDGDNTLIARLRTNLNIHMKKRFDRNHIVKNIGKHLYTLQASKKVKLSKTVILHIQKCLKYSFAKNQGDGAGLEDNLKAIIPHQFGDHSLCKAIFCGFKRNPENKYLHRSLPYKAAIKDDTGNLRSELEKIFAPVVANAEQYADLGSSQQCEHANREVMLRAPKSHHYGGSESLDFRVHATAAFINEGREYISQVNSEMGLSPGVHTLQYAKKCMLVRKRSQEKSALPSSKRRRLILKQERANTQGAQEVLEGVSYQSGIGLETEVDVEELPDALPRGEFKPVVLSSGEPTLVVIDLETTDLIRSGQVPHITQIAGMVISSGEKFNMYVHPKLPIATGAQQATGITMANNEMFVSGKKVATTSIQTAVTELLLWLDKFPNVFLVAHNGRKFDFPVLISAISNVQALDKFFSCVIGLLDSLTMLRKVLPGRGSYKQEDLVADLLHATYPAHDALEDVLALGKLIIHCSVPTQELLKFTFTPKAIHLNCLFLRERTKNMPTLSVLVANGVCKSATAENIAGSGLNIAHLRKIFERDGEDGLLSTFTGKNCEGQPRVTNTKRTLETVIPKLAEFLNKK